MEYGDDELSRSGRPASPQQGRGSTIQSSPLEPKDPEDPMVPEELKAPDGPAAPEVNADEPDGSAGLPAEDPAVVPGSTVDAEPE
ncbi:MAG: hypothetical protein H0T78_04920 [Longispora sp.]|nr:hypothetical protein [Longispora sp. (in: high G+C Gram-positive bacteria)]